MDHSQRVVNPQPTVKIQEPPSQGGTNGLAKDAAEALWTRNQNKKRIEDRIQPEEIGHAAQPKNWRFPRMIHSCALHPF